MDRSPSIIIDGDDTLWMTMPLYTRAKAEFYRLMEDAGFGTDEATTRLAAIDRARVSALAFTRTRFPGSLVETYRACCSSRGLTPDHRLEVAASKIGESVFAQPAEIAPHAGQVLRRLGEHFSIVLATKGDPAIQAERISQSGLRELFDWVFVLHDKTSSEFRQVVRRATVDVARSWSVGNSVRSDILPALEVGLRTVWIPAETWEYEEAQPPSSERVFVCRDLLMMMDVVLSEAM